MVIGVLNELQSSGQAVGSKAQHERLAQWSPANRQKRPVQSPKAIQRLRQVQHPLFGDQTPGKSDDNAGYRQFASHLPSRQIRPARQIDAYLWNAMDWMDET